MPMDDILKYSVKKFVNKCPILSLILLKKLTWEFPGSLVVRTPSAPSLTRAWVQSLVRELRTCKLQGVAKKKKKESDVSNIFQTNRLLLLLLPRRIFI